MWIVTSNAFNLCQNAHNWRHIVRPQQIVVTFDALKSETKCYFASDIHTIRWPTLSLPDKFDCDKSLRWFICIVCQFNPIGLVSNYIYVNSKTLIQNIKLITASSICCKLKLLMKQHKCCLMFRHCGHGINASGSVYISIFLLMNIRLSTDLLIYNVYIYIHIFGLTNHVGTAREGGRRSHDFVVIMRWRQGPIMPDTVHMVAKSEASSAVN